MIGNIYALVKLAKLAKTCDELPAAERALLDLLEPCNIEAHYPSQKNKILHSLTTARCRGLISDTERLLQWIKAKCDAELKNTLE